MFNGILRRVISNPDNMDDDDENHVGNDTTSEAAYDNAEDSHNDGHVVVIDTSEIPSMHRSKSSNAAPLTMIHSRSNISSGAMSTGSTLSDNDDQQDGSNLMDITSDEPQQQQPPAPLRIIRRADSEELSQRAMSSQNSSRDWGWFEDVHNANSKAANAVKRKQPGGSCSVDGSVVMMQLRETNPEDSAAAMAVTAPTYVLEESLSSQHLWKKTAGQRPPQPIEERSFYEKMWAQNFQRSQVNYSMPSDVLTAASPISLSPWTDGNFSSQGTAELENYNLPANISKRAHTAAEEGDVAEAALVSRMNHDAGDIQQVINRRVHGSEGDLIILVRGDNVFGTTVSKSFVRNMGQGVDTVNVSIASYRVVESPQHGKYAQFLVIYREGSLQDTIGVWKRYRDFEDLARAITSGNEGCKALVSNMSPLAVTEEPELEHLPNAIMSWRLLQKRKRWYRCLDAGYLSLKVFLLERFLHDILFESTSPKVLRAFVGPTAV